MWHWAALWHHVVCEAHSWNLVVSVTGGEGSLSGLLKILVPWGLHGIWSHLVVLVMVMVVGDGSDLRNEEGNN